MADKIIENNQVSMVGVVASEFVKSHEVYGEGTSKRGSLVTPNSISTWHRFAILCVFSSA